MWVHQKFLKSQLSVMHIFPYPICSSSSNNSMISPILLILVAQSDQGLIHYGFKISEILGVCSI